MPARSGSSPPGWLLPDGRDPLRPFMDGQEAADAVAGAMGVIEAGLPTETGGRSCRAGCRACRRERRRGRRAIWPLSTRVKRSRISASACRSRRCGSRRWCRRDIGRRNRPDRASSARSAGWSPRSPDNGRWRRSGPAPEMVSKLRSLRSPLAWRKSCSFAAARARRRRPSGASTDSQWRKRDQRGAVARLGGPVAGDLGLVLDRLGQHGGIALGDHSRAGLLERLEDRRHRPLRIDRRRSCRRARRRSASKALALVQRGRRCRDAGGRRRRPSRRRRTDRRCRPHGPARRPERPACGRRPGRAR